jgi:hypothetical protein
MSACTEGSVRYAVLGGAVGRSGGTVGSDAAGGSVAAPTGAAIEPEDTIPSGELTHGAGVPAAARTIGEATNAPDAGAAWAAEITSAAASPIAPSGTNGIYLIVPGFSTRYRAKPAAPGQYRQIIAHRPPPMTSLGLSARTLR